MRFAALLTLAAGARANFDDSGFGDWFTDSTEEVEGAELKFEGMVPDYVRGSFVQAGPAKWGMGDMKMTHVFDGYAKINHLEFGPEGRVTFSSVFMQSAFLKDSVQMNRVAPSMLMGYTDPPLPWGPTNFLFGRQDNNFIKTQKFGELPILLSDTMLINVLSKNFTHLDDVVKPLMELYTPGTHWEDHNTAVTGEICMMGTMSHGHTDPKTGKFYAVLGCSGVGSIVGHTMQDYHIAFTIDPKTPYRRDRLAKIPLPWGRPASYMHAMGFTANHLVIVAQPLHIDFPRLMTGRPLSDGGLILGKDATTIFQVVSRHDASVRSFHVPAFLFAHVVNTWEEDNGDILLDLTWYHFDDTLAFFRLMLFDMALNKTARDAAPLSKLIRFRLKADGTTEQSDPFANEPQTMFELPKINGALEGKMYCVMYAFQGHSYDYAKSMDSTEAGPYGAIGIAKRNLCTGKRAGFYAANVFPSEPEFIPRPGAKSEDDGVLVHLIYDANAHTSYVQILDAKTMERVALAPLPVRVPFVLHSTFFPLEGDEKTALLVSASKSP